MSAVACEIDQQKISEPVSTAVIKDTTAKESLSSPSTPLNGGAHTGDDSVSDESSITSQSSQEYVSFEATRSSFQKASTADLAVKDKLSTSPSVHADTSFNSDSSDEEELQAFNPYEKEKQHEIMNEKDRKNDHSNNTQNDDVLSNEPEPAGQDSSVDSSNSDFDASTIRNSSSPATSLEKDDYEMKITSQAYINQDSTKGAKDTSRFLRMSQVSVSELNEVSLDEVQEDINRDKLKEKEKQQQEQNPEEQQPSRSILKTLTDASTTILAKARSDTPTSTIETTAIPTSTSAPRNTTKPSPILTNRSSADSGSSARSLFGIWSSIKNGAKRRASESSNTSSATVDVANTPLIVEHRSVATDDARHISKRLSQRRSVSQPLLLHEDDILAQMEQLNAANTNDPKARMLNSLKRQSLRKSLASQYKETDDYDWDFWAGALCDFEQTVKSKKLLQHVQRGIPPSIRGMVWQLLSGSKDQTLQAQYIDLLKAPSPYEKMIQRDLARTFPGHKFFKERDGVGQEGLYNVVRSYSVLDQDVGYCQGLAFIVGPLLLNMPDDEAFCVLVQLMKTYGLRGHYTPDMEGLHLRLYQFDALVEEHLPHIARHLVQQSVGSTMYASQWFMTLFAYKFPLNLVFRIYDILLTEGIVSIFKFALALLKRNETAILSLDFEHLLNFLKNGLFEEYKDDDRRLVDDAVTFEISPKRLLQLEKEHKAQMAKEVADARTVEQLQRTNAELRKRSKELEQTTLTVRREQNDIYEQLKQTKADLAHAKDEHASLVDLVQVLRQEVEALPGKIEAQCRAQFDDLCSENHTLVEKNSALEDQLSNLETMVIDMKMRYAQSENERGELQQRLYEMKKLISA